MKRQFNILPIILISFLAACQHAGKSRPFQEIESDLSESRISVQEFQNILDSAGVEGCILVYKFNDKTWLSNDFNWAEIGRLPASTFKIPNSIIALETGVMESDSSIIPWDGHKRWLDSWNKDMTLGEALQFSCVPCYQRIAREVGADRMRQWLDTLHYGQMVFDSNTIDKFWLEGNSKISPYEQIDFLKRLYFKEIPISVNTSTIITRMLILDKNTQFTLSGKTGWSIRGGNNNGWFVGYVETENGVSFFATNVNPGTEFKMDFFPVIRKQITLAALKKVNVIH